MAAHRAGIELIVLTGRESLGYIGDDINDYSAMSLVAFVGCPKDSCEQVKGISLNISDVCGGAGGAWS